MAFEIPKGQEDDYTKALYFMRLSLDYALNKGEFSGIVNDAEDKFFKRSKMIYLSDDLIDRVDNVSREYNALSDYDQHFVQYMMGLGKTIHEQPTYKGFKNDIYMATQDWKSGRFEESYKDRMEKLVRDNTPKQRPVAKTIIIDDEKTRSITRER